MGIEADEDVTEADKDAIEVRANYVQCAVMLKARVCQPLGVRLWKPRNAAFLGVLAQQSINARRETQVVDADLADVERAHAAMVATWQPGTRTRLA